MKNQILSLLKQEEVKYVHVLHTEKNVFLLTGSGFSSWEIGFKNASDDMTHFTNRTTSEDKNTNERFLLDCAVDCISTVLGFPK